MHPFCSKIRNQYPAILPSLLLCDFGNLAKEISALEQAGVPGFHLDVMDGVFVPNFTYGLPIVEAVNGLSDLPIDVHLMITEPIKYVPQFHEAGADMISFHAEATDRVGDTISAIKDTGAAVGLAVNPGTEINSIAQHLCDCDMVVIMSVEAGFGGQSFQPGVLEKFKIIREIAGPDVLLEIDGGVNEKSIASCAERGAEAFVVGSGIFKKPDYIAAINSLKSLVGAATASQ